MFKSSSYSSCSHIKEDSSTNCTFVCPYCDEGGWDSETELVIHKKAFHTIEIKAMAKKNLQTACMTCSKIFSKRELLSHYKEAHLHTSPNADVIERETFICNYCCRLFFNKSLLELHISKKHMKSPILECPLCKRQVTISATWRHLESHQMNSVSVCPICLLKCKNTDSLNKHLTNHPKYYNCNLCGYVTTREANFTRHLKRYTEIEVTGKEYADLNVEKYYLMPNTHVWWQKGMSNYGTQGLLIANKVFICVLCRHICANLTQCKKHIYTSHMKPPLVESVNPTNYTCVCGEQFTTSILLKQHVFRLKEPHQDIKNVKNYITNVEVK